MCRTSVFSGFYELSIGERLQFVKEFADLTDEEVRLLRSVRSLSLERADRMIENVVGVIPIPVGIAVNFLINGRDYLIPMATEESSVVAAASYAAKMTRPRGGFFAGSTEPVMIGQIQVTDVCDPHGARMALLESQEEILTTANEGHKMTAARGLNARVIGSSSGSMLVAELQVDCRDVMGANVVNTMAEAVAPLVESITGGRVCVRIVSNLATKRMARAWTVVAKEAVGGEEIVDRIVKACDFAVADSYRATTHNKGMLNGVVAVLQATCNDYRAVEAGAHAYAARDGRYGPLAVWEKNRAGDLVGSVELPMAVGILGGAVKAHPIARIAMKILGVRTASEFAELLAAVGLAQNLGALRALADEGLQKGHMSLHARNVAMAGGATGELIDIIAERMVAEGRIGVHRAVELMEEYRDTHASGKRVAGT